MAGRPSTKTRNISPEIKGIVVEQWPIDRPIPYARNARKLSGQAVDKVAASLKEFGWQQPLVVDAHDVLIVGHTRLMAAKKLGMTEVPVLVAHWLTPAQVKAYRLMDNRSHQETDWDFDLLGPEFEERDVWQIKREVTGEYVHPTQKPVSLIERALRNSSRGEDVVLDLFGGSGSTLIACEKTGRLACLMELDPKYGDVIVTRWQDFTGKEATLEGHGATFAHVKEGRILGEQDSIKEAALA